MAKVEYRSIPQYGAVLGASLIFGSTLARSFGATNHIPFMPECWANQLISLLKMAYVDANMKIITLQSVGH